MKNTFCKIDIQFFSDDSENRSENNIENNVVSSLDETENSKHTEFSENQSSDSIDSSEDAFFSIKENEECSSEDCSENEQLNENAESSAEECDNSVEKKSISRIILTSIFDLVEVFSYALAMMVIVFLFVFKFVTVDGHSMMGTLKHEDRLVVYNLFYYPESNDVIVINYEDRSELLVKRVIGVEGDEVKIDFDTWEIWVNNEKLSQPYLLNSPEYGVQPMEKGHFSVTDDDNCVSFKVEKGKVFVLGDNRNHSSDSRVFGQMDIEEILGKVVFRVYPFENAGSIS